MCIRTVGIMYGIFLCAFGGTLACVTGEASVPIFELSLMGTEDVVPRSEAFWGAMKWLVWWVAFQRVWIWCGGRRGRRLRPRSKRGAWSSDSKAGRSHAALVRRRSQNQPPASRPWPPVSEGEALMPLPAAPTRATVEKAIVPHASLETWVADEVGQTVLGDARLTTRLEKLVMDFSAHPTATIPEACGDWKGTKAAYRFFDNSRLSHAQILGGSRQACVDRMSDAELILVVQDTTSLDYTAHPTTKDVGPLEAETHHGLFVHSCLAVTASGVPLGLLDQQSWAREAATTGKRASRKQRSIEQKESFKWLLGLRKSLDGVPASVCLVTVADQEADIFDLFLDAEEHGTHLLIRSAWDRCVEGSAGHLHPTVEQSAVVKTYTVSVGRAPDRLPREARMALRFTTVSVCPPRHRRHEAHLHPITLSAVDVQEIAPPEGQKPLHWRLLTSMPIQTCDDAYQCVCWYGLRWLVERYHFVLKSGCRIEQRQLGTAARLQNCLGVYAIVAWRLLWLTYQARQTPKASCEIAFEPEEWQTLYCHVHHTSVPPATPPSLDEALRWLAQLGGFLNRKGDGAPGVKVLWRGWQRLQDMVKIWRLLRPPPTYG